MLHKIRKINLCTNYAKINYWKKSNAFSQFCYRKISSRLYFIHIQCEAADPLFIFHFTCICPCEKCSEKLKQRKKKSKRK